MILTNGRNMIMRCTCGRFSTSCPCADCAPVPPTVRESAHSILSRWFPRHMARIDAERTIKFAADRRARIDRNAEDLFAGVKR